MTKQRDRIDYELLILLAGFIALALAAKITGRSAGFEVVTETTPVMAVTAPAVHSYTVYLHDGSANPYWAPSHAFARRPIPLYSSEAVADLPVEASRRR